MPYGDQSDVMSRMGMERKGFTAGSDGLDFRPVGQLRMEITYNGK
jgi:hypothetical protein